MIKRIIIVALIIALIATTLLYHPFVTHGAMDFNGSTNEITIKNNNTLCNLTSTTVSNMTISMWVRRDTATPGNLVWKSNDNDTNDGWAIVNNGASIGFMVIGATSNSVKSVPVAQFPLGVWTHMVWTLVGNGQASTSQTAYINGVIPTYASSTAGAGTHNDACSATVPIHIGKGFLGSSGFGGQNSSWTGGIDDIQIYKRVLTQTEIILLYKYGYPQGPRDKLVGWWQPRDKTPVMVDLSGNLNFATSSVVVPTYKGYNKPQAHPYL
jgi:hypothetical protein